MRKAEHLSTTSYRVVGVFFVPSSDNEPQIEPLIIAARTWKRAFELAKLQAEQAIKAVKS